MHVPLHYQASEYDCVPTAFINAICHLFERREIPPMVIRHIYMYSLDTVGRTGRFGTAGTSREAIRLLGRWLDSYKAKKFSVSTEYLEGDEVHLRPGSKVIACLQDGGVALCNILLTRREEHYLTATEVQDGWVYCFDPYFRTAIRGLRRQVCMIESPDGRSPNLRIRIEWMDQADEKRRFCFGPFPTRECLLIWRNR